ncbi:hypothetical protein [Plantactinospora sonchi]|uniref:LppX_LprAFG lipoprotein n=1 Tax=Plantactinospora sonchi TaxID=1544735 RepID=A0ABU7RKZ9_9ACTN
MRIRRLGVSGLALVATLSVGVAGCNTQGGSGRPVASGVQETSAAAQTPAEALEASVKKLNEQSFTVSLHMSVMTASGGVDPVARKANLTMEIGLGDQSMDYQVITADEDVFLKFGGVPGMPKDWLRIDAAKIKEGSGLDVLPKDDPMGANNLIKGIVEVSRDGERGFKGTMDLTKSPTADAESMKMFGDKVTSVPFTARTDEQGRLTEISVNTKSVSPLLGEMRVAYDNFGKPVEIKTPDPSEVTEMPDELLGLMNA